MSLKKLLATGAIVTSLGFWAVAAHGADQTNDTTGPSSDNDNTLTVTNDIDVDVDNDFDGDVDVDQDMDTGDNDTNGNTTVEDVSTGEAKGSFKLKADVKQESAVDVDGWSDWLADAADTDQTNDTTGPSSDNDNTATFTNDVDIDVDNDADLDIDYDCDADTGDNDTEDNTTVGDVSTGDASCDADVEITISQG